MTVAHFKLTGERKHEKIFIPELNATSLEKKMYVRFSLILFNVIFVVSFTKRIYSFFLFFPLTPFLGG